MSDRLQQVFELLLKTEGEQEAARLRSELKQFGDTAEAAADDTQGLLDKVEELASTSKSVADLAQLSAALEGTSEELRQASDGLIALNKEFDATDTSSRRVVQAYKMAEAAIARLTAEQIKQSEAIQRARTQLSAAGVDVEQLAAEERRLQDEAKSASAEILAQARAANAAKEAQRQLAERLAQGDEAFRRQSQASRTAREALEKYRGSSQAAATSQEQLSSAGERGVGVFSRLRGALAGLTAFFGIREAVEGTKNILGLGDAAERTEAQLARLFGGEAQGRQAFEQLRALAESTGQEFDVIREQAIKLKAFGLDPLGGSLQALIDENAAVGGSNERLAGTILAVGQAYSKQKLQGEEILQLIERGVPVWDLLAKATGKNVPELQKLSEAGKLGRKEIAQLLEEIGKANEGAAAEGLGRLSGLVQQLRDRITKFFTEVSNSGALDFFKQRLQALITQFDALRASGDLTALAKRFSDAIVSIASALEAGVRFAVQYSAAIIEIGKAYAAVQFAAFLGGMARSAAAMLAAGTAAAATARQVGGLRGALAAIPATLKITVAAIGVEVLISRLIDLKEKMQEVREAEREQADAADRAAQLRSQYNAEIQASLKYLEEYRNTQIRSAEELQSLNEAELSSYQRRINEAARYYAALSANARELGNAAEATAAEEQLQRYRQALADLEARLAAFKKAKEEGFATPADQGLSEAFKTLGVDAQNTGNIITEEGGKIIAAFTQIATSSETSARQVGAAFVKALDSANTTAEVDKLQSALSAAFEAGRISAKQYEQGAKLAAERTREIDQAADVAAGGFVKVEQASEGATDKIIEGWKIAREALAAQAQAIANDLAAAIKSGADQSSEEFKALAAKYQTVDAELGKLNRSIDNATKAQAGLGNQSTTTASQVEKTTQSAEGLAAGVDEVERSTTRAGGALQAMSESAADLFQVINQGIASGSSLDVYTDKINRLNDRITAQNEAARRRLQTLDEELARYDPLAQKLEQLRKQYKLVDDATLREIAEREQRLEREQERLQRETEQATQQPQAQPRAQRQPSPGVPGPAPAGGGNLTVNINIEGALISSDPRELARLLGRAMYDELQAIERLRR